MCPDCFPGCCLGHICNRTRPRHSFLLDGRPTRWARSFTTLIVSEYCRHCNAHGRRARGLSVADRRPATGGGFATNAPRGRRVCCLPCSVAKLDQRGADADTRRCADSGTHLSAQPSPNGARIFAAERTGFELGGSTTRARRAPGPPRTPARGSRRRAAGAIDRSTDGIATVPSTCHRTVGLARAATPAGPHPQRHKAGQRSRRRFDRARAADGVWRCFTAAARAAGAGTAGDSCRSATWRRNRPGG